MPEITNPHDRFFKEVFARKEVAADFLRNYLPADVLACVDENYRFQPKATFGNPQFPLLPYRFQLKAVFGNLIV